MDKFDRDFNKQAKNMFRFGCLVFVIEAAIAIGAISFIIWVIVTLMKHWGAI